MAKTLYKYSVVEAQNASLGQAGLKLIDDSNENNSPFVSIQGFCLCVVRRGSGKIL